jgi:peptidoglycan-associated lipoprotein
MKLNKLIFPLLLALTTTVALTGCHHGPPKITPLPGHRAGQTGGDGSSSSSPLGPGGVGGEGEQPIAGTGANTKPGGGELPDNWRPEDMFQDRDKLAAFTVHFKYDSSVVEDSEQANLASVGQALTADSNAKLLIEGHCDERGTEEYNRALGERRALALREALAKDGVDPMRIRTISYGKDKPADPGHDESAWAKNRRGEFIYCTPKNTTVQ